MNDAQNHPRPRLALIEGLLLLLGVGFSLGSLYLAGLVFHEIQGTLALGVFNMAGSHAETSLRLLAGMFLAALFTALGSLTLTMGFYLAVRHLRQGKEKDKEEP